MRYLPMVKRLAPNLIFDVRAELTRLAEFNKIAPDIVTTTRHSVHFGSHWPLFSLPLLFGTTLDTIPRSILPGYLKAPPMENHSGCRIGVFRQSFSTLHEEATDRNLPDADFERLVRECPFRMMSLHQEDLKAFDLYDTARFMYGLDLIVTTDSAVAHLAGALGKKTFLMLPVRCCWRWLQNRSDSPWYPTMTLFRQKTPRDWGPVIDEVLAAIKDTIHGPDPEQKLNESFGFPYTRKMEKPWTVAALEAARLTGQ
jgi:hypothetical protein